MAPLLFCSLASEEEHEDEEDEEDEHSDDEVEEEGGREAAREGCSAWGLADDVEGRGTSPMGGPRMSSVEQQDSGESGLGLLQFQSHANGDRAGGSLGRESDSSTDGFQLFIIAASHRFSNLSGWHCMVLFQSAVPPPPPKQFW